MSTELKPCPFCGSTELGHYTDDVQTPWVECFVCEATGPEDDPDGTKWNAAPRPGDPTDTQLLDWLQSRTVGYGTGWVARNSTTERGFRLHESSRPNGSPDVREAISRARAQEGTKMPAPRARRR